MYIHVWQPQVEIKHYSVVYFNRVAVFEALQRRTPVKGGAHTHSVYMHEYLISQ